MFEFFFMKYNLSLTILMNIVKKNKKVKYVGDMKD